MVRSDYVTFTPVVSGFKRAALSLTPAGEVALAAWLQSTQGKLVYKTLDKDNVLVSFNQVELGTWEREGDEPSARGYRRVGHRPPYWSFHPADFEDPQTAEKFRGIKTPLFEGLTLPSAAKKWLLDELVMRNVIQG